MMKPLYLYRLPTDYHYRTGYRFKHGFVFYGGITPWLTINADGTITIKSGYAWDGCSPKFKLMGAIRGTPDGPINPETNLPVAYHASLVHDALCQFRHEDNMPFTKLEIDQIFYQILRRDGFKYARLYYSGVRLFGRVYSLLGKLIKKSTEGLL